MTHALRSSTPGPVVKFLRPFCLLLAAQVLAGQASAQSAETVRWLEDLDVLARELPRRHMAPETERPIGEFRADVEQLRRRLDSLSREQIILEFARLAASFGDSHTELPLAQEGVGFHRVPLGLYFFGSDLRVIVVAPGDEDLLGLRLVAIGGNPIAVVLDRVRPVIGDDHGNPYEILHSGPAFVTIPEVLIGLGLATPDEPIEFAFETEDRQRVTRTFSPVLLADAGRHMSVRLVRPEQEPLFMRSRNLWYVMERVRDSDVLYVRVSRSQNQSGSESLATFARTVSSAIAAPDVQRVVVDLRQNTGGNFNRTEPLVEAICRAAEKGTISSVYVILGRHTYSAAIVLAGQLKHGCDASLVGETPRAAPNRQADTGSFRLPNSGLEVSYSDRLRQAFPELGDARQIPLDLPAPPDWDDYRSGRDPALEAILSAVATAK